MGGGRWAAAGALLALAAGLLAAGSASEYDYVSFQSDIGAYQSGRFYTKPAQCVDIPADLRLCHNVGYKRMVLPNLLEHETMAEVKQQASSWVPLLNKNCHIGTQVFLCSLFAPVCLDRPVYPCRWLCEAVRDSCEPVMQFFGFYWPEMLKCDKFPEGDVCIAMTPPNATEASKPQAKKRKKKKKNPQQTNTPAPPPDFERNEFNPDFFGSRVEAQRAASDQRWGAGCPGHWADISRAFGGQGLRCVCVCVCVCVSRGRGAGVEKPVACWLSLSPSDARGGMSPAGQAPQSEGWVVW
ncbi:hypothetical protein FD755_015246 [Muntiacus reevesi]|uniref:FZ domain-containing protein n=1 Tax=Muntiacus reevesi TaxID=9886 RepID=A0A5N3XKH0_MUNRE|nr:hypothetical protein FD755_015246 [Muntiacus reevesi]